LRRWIVRATGALAVVFVLVQLVPYGRDHTNPAVVAEPAWNSPETRALAVRACFDCHSDETVWHWYSNIAPFSWLIQRDVDEGRRRLNFSDWTATRRVRDVAEAIRRGDMPPLQYRLLHPEARLSDAEKTALESGLTATLQGG
jgi:hypothetical protein